MVHTTIKKNTCDNYCFQYIHSNHHGALNQYRAAKLQKACVAKQIELLSVLDSHMLSDIGMKGFNRLAPEQQESLLLEAIRQA